MLQNSLKRNKLKPENMLKSIDELDERARTYRDDLDRRMHAFLTMTTQLTDAASALQARVQRAEADLEILKAKVK